MFSIYDILKEADGDNNADTGATTDNPAGAADDAAPADDNSGGDDSNQDDDDFNMDASLDDDAEAGDDAGGDDSGDDSSDGDMGGGSDLGGSDDDGDEETISNNASIFDSLTAEEQQMKIMELKNQYRDLFTSTADIVDKLDNFSVDENNYIIINRAAEAIRKVRAYLSDYFIYSFPNKTYIENDVKFNEFLYIIKKISSVLDKYSTQVEKEEDK